MKIMMATINIYADQQTHMNIWCIQVYGVSIV